jgi:two-component system, OmpR family, response regulator CssR
MPCRVFVVEDESDLCRLIAKYLTRIGYRVETALTGEDAWSAIESTTDFPVVFIIDLSLPGMDGADLARRILNLQPQTFVLLTSGYPVDVSGIGPAGSHVSFLLKPFSPGRLSEELNRFSMGLGIP